MVFCRNPLAEIKKVEKFLELPDYFSKDNFIYPHEGSKSKFPCFKTKEGDVKCMKGDKGRKHPKLRRSTVEFLKNKFGPMANEFHKLTGLRLSVDQEE